MMYISHMIGFFFNLEKGILLRYIYLRYAKMQNQTEIPKTVFCFHFFFWQFTSCVLHYSLKCIVHLCYCSNEVFLLHHNKFGRSLYIIIYVRASHIRCQFRNSNAHVFSGSRSSWFMLTDHIMYGIWSTLKLLNPIFGYYSENDNI